MFKHAFDWMSSSVVRITYEEDEGAKVVGAGTGFFLRGFLITNYHVYHQPEGRDVRIKFAHYHDTKTDDVVISDQVFHDSLVRASCENAFDYAFFDPYYIPKSKQTLLNRLWTPRMHQPSIGDEVGLAGFPFGKNRIAGHLCRISSIYQSGPATVVQLEGSINNSNSGGPLFSLQERAVIGIVTRKEAGLTEKFKPLVAELEDDISRCGAPGYFGQSADAKVTDAVVKTQKQLLSFAQELARSSNTGIGYAISIEHLLSDGDFQARAAADPYGTY